MAISTNGAIITRVTSALYGEYLSNASYTEVKDTAPATVAANFMANDFVGKTDLQVANTILTNLGLTSITGLDNWLSAQLTAAGSTAAAKGAALVSILNGYANMTSDATYGSYATSFNAKVEAGLVKSQTAGAAGGAYATADVVTVTNNTLTLTTGVDTGAAFTGGSGNDTFNADLSSAGANTLNALDKLSGGAGDDTLNAVLAADVTPSSITGIESIIATGSGGARTLGLTNATGVTSVTASGSAGGTLTVTGIAAGANLAVQSQAVGADFQYATTTGTQAANLSVAAVTGAATITVDGVETIAVTASGSASTYQLAADSVTSLSIAGATNQTVTLADMTGVSHFDASAATGNVSLTLINQSGLLATTDLTVTGGSGNDTLVVSSHTQSDISVNGGAGNDTITHTAASTADTINGGEGTDTLSTTDARVDALDDATPTTYTITNIETLSISDQYGASTDLTLDTMDIATSITKVVLANSAANTAITADAVTIEGPAGSFTVDLGSANATNTGRVLDDTLTLQDTGTAVTDSVSLVNKSTVSSTGLAIDVFAGQSVTSTGYESVSINTGANTGGAEQTIATLTITPDSTDAAVSLTVSGANAFDITTSLTTTSTAKMTVDASGLAAQAAGTTTFDINSTSQGTGGTASITGSDGDDSIVVGNFASTIVGGAGNDTLTGGTAKDNIQGGDGIDTISDGGGNDTISGGAGNDSITISGTSVNVDAGDGNDTVNADATLSSGDVVNGGAGNDTLAIDAAATASSSQGVTNFEYLRADTALTQDMVQFTTNTGFTRLISNVAGNVTFNNVSSNVTELRSLTHDGGDTLTFDRLLDNSSNAVTVGTYTNANTTINTLVADDEETINFVAGGATTAGRTFTVTALTAADLVTLNVSGATNFTTTIGSTSEALATVDASSNTGTVSISATNATTDVTMTGSATAASTLVGGSGADVITGGTTADSLTGGSGADTISGGNGDDSLLGGASADSITGGEGADVITGGTGNDTIVLTETTAAIDNVILTASATNGVDTLTAFATGTGIDTITFVAADTTVGTTGAAGVFEAIAAVTLVTGATYDLTGDNTLTTANVDVYELLGTNASNGDLSQSTTGTELFKLLGTADSAATSITMDNADDNVFLIAYDNGNAYIYNVQDQATGSTAIASEVILVAVVTGVAVGGFASGDLLAA
jgi:Ca2+-binding RTX toxin-like protein